jgi:hypothetical protein
MIGQTTDRLNKLPNIFPGFPFFEKLADITTFTDHFAFDGGRCFLGVRQLGSGLNADTLTWIPGWGRRDMFTFFACRHE